MRRHQIVLFCTWIALTVTDCSRTGSDPSRRIAARATSPEAAFALQYELLRARDADGMWELLSERARVDMEGLAKDLRRLPEHVFREEFGYPRSELEGLDARGVLGQLMRSPKMFGASSAVPAVEEVDQQDDDIALVRFRSEGAECRQRFRREAGAWHVDALKACRRTRPRTAPSAAPGGR